MYEDDELSVGSPTLLGYQGDGLFIRVGETSTLELAFGLS
jgi:hypothetical protein